MFSSLLRVNRDDQGSELGLTPFTGSDEAESMGLPDSEFAMARSSPAARTALPQVAREFGCVLSDLDDAFELEPTRLRLLLDHLSRIEDPREPRRNPTGHRSLTRIRSPEPGTTTFSSVSSSENQLTRFPFGRIGVSRPRHGRPMNDQRVGSGRLSSSRLSVDLPATGAHFL